MAQDWDAVTYDRIAEPQTLWGRVVLDRLPLAGSERVLDAGCGSGRVTERLLRRVPRGRVVALDASEAMLAQARRRLGPDVDYVRADLGAPLAIDEPVDAVFSTATFHWVVDHDALFANLAAVLRPGGALVAQCGGTGNASRALAIAEALGRAGGPINFAGPEETAQRLRAAGFVDVWTWLSPEPYALEPPDLEAFLATVVLRTHIDGMTGDERSEFLRAVAARLPGGEIDYVRLNILARRSTVAEL